MAPAERRLLVLALIVVPLAAAGLRTIGMRRTQSILRRLPSARLCGDRIEPSQVARIVEIASRLGIIRAKCLPLSLTLQSLLAGSGVSAELRLGVRKYGGRLEAHAWVEHDGMALLEAAGVHDRFTAFTRAIGAQHAAKS
jgi:hypothetical protein